MDKRKCTGKNAISVLTFNMTDPHIPQQYKEQTKEQQLNEEKKEARTECFLETFLSNTPYTEANYTMVFLIFCMQILYKMKDFWQN